jgi:ferritin-like metal-binding protein YciE
VSATNFEEKTNMTITSTHEMLVEQLRDLYDAEKQLVKALPKIAKAANSGELREAIEGHLQETEGQVTRLEEAFDHLDTPAKGKACKGMKGLLEEGKEAMEEEAAEPFADLAIIAAAQRVEHYEIAGYGTARALAEHLGESEVAALMDQTLEEESNADSKLTEIAMALLENADEDEESRDETADSPTRRPARVGARSGKSR